MIRPTPLAPGSLANAGCSDANPAQAVACLRAIPAADLVNDESNLGFTSVLVRGTRALPEDPRSAIRSGDFSHVPVLIGGTLDEGRAFTSSDIGWTRSDYEDWVHTVFGTNASAVIAKYPWPANADQFTPAYLTGAILTDAGIIGPASPPIEAGIGGCGTAGADQGHRAPYQGLCLRMGSARRPGHRAEPRLCERSWARERTRLPLAQLRRERRPDLVAVRPRRAATLRPDRQVLGGLREERCATLRSAVMAAVHRDFRCAAFTTRSRSKPVARQRDHFQGASLLPLEQADRELTLDPRAGV